LFFKVPLQFDSDGAGQQSQQGFQSIATPVIVNAKICLNGLDQQGLKLRYVVELEDKKWWDQLFDAVQYLNEVKMWHFDFVQLFSLPRFRQYRVLGPAHFL
jgi:hypothetical protein